MKKKKKKKKKEKERNRKKKKKKRRKKSRKRKERRGGVGNKLFLRPALPTKEKAVSFLRVASGFLTKPHPEGLSLQEGLPSLCKKKNTRREKKETIGPRPREPQSSHGGGSKEHLPRKAMEKMILQGGSHGGERGLQSQSALKQSLCRAGEEYSREPLHTAGVVR